MGTSGRLADPLRPQETAALHFAYVKNDIKASMAVWKGQVANFRVKINNVDHLPPHCHACCISGKEVKVVLTTLEVLNPPPHELPPNLRKGLRGFQEEMLEAWEQVHVTPPGDNPEF